MRRTVIGLAIFFVSGACGLAYEVVWTRLLGLSIGHTTVAITAVTAAYMAGLAGGSAFFGRYLQRGVHPARLYAALEAGVAIMALLFPVLLVVVTQLSAASGRSLEHGSFALGSVRFLLAALAVAPATFLMGGTLPAMIEAVPPRDRSAIANQAGILYAVNTAGAVVGAALAGFVLVEAVGTLETTWIAAVGNLMVAAAAYRLASPNTSHSTGSTKTTVTDAPRVSSGGSDTMSSPPYSVLIAYGLSGCAALALQVVWTRALVFFAGSTTYAFTSMLIVFLTGITIGSTLAVPLLDRVRRHAGLFIGLQCLMAMTAAASLGILSSVSATIDRTWPSELSWASLVTGNFAKAAATMAATTLLMGALFPVTMKLVSRGGAPRDGVHGGGGAAVLLGRLYAWNTVGGIVGAAASGLVLIPTLGIRGTLLVACFVSVLAAGLVWMTHGRRTMEAIFLPVALLAITIVATQGVPLHVPAGSEQLLFYEEGASATVSVMQEVTGTRTIYIDRVPVAGTDAIMLTDQKSLAHVPMLLHADAKRVLTVGFGSGGASWSFAQHPSVERIDAVEIDSTVLRAAPHLEDSNHGVWRDSRFNVVLEDARNYLASTNALYDVISTDCTDLRYKTNANLYTVEYFTLVRDHLTPGGLVTVWMPLGGLGGDTFRMALRTFQRVFPHATVWYMTNQPTHYLLLIGSDRELRPDVTVLASRLSDPAPRRDLSEIRLDDALKLAASLLLDESEVGRFVGAGPVNTDRHPLLEFQAPRLAYRDALAMNLRATVSARDHTAGDRRWQGDADTLARLAPYNAATPVLIEGHVRYQLGTFDYEGALKLYRAAQSMNPADRSIPLLISDVERTRHAWLAEFASRVGSGSTNVRDWLAHASLLRQTGRLDDAVAAGRRATELAPESTDTWMHLAATYSQKGDVDAAVSTLQHARQTLSADPMLLSDLGAALNEQQRFAESESVLRQSLVLRATADAYNNLGVALNSQRRHDEAIRELGHALELNTHSADAWFNLGVAHAMLGEQARARDAYRRGLALTPAEPRALHNLALIEAEGGRLDLAARYLTEAVTLEPSSASLHNELGRAYLGLHRPLDAISAFERALQLDPSSSAARDNLDLARRIRSDPPAMSGAP